MKMILIPAGTYRMGDLAAGPVEATAAGTQVPPLSSAPTSPVLKPDVFLIPDVADELPAHTVTITHPFYLSESEVTAKQYQAFRMDYEDAGTFPPSVSGVSWYDAVDFTNWLSKKEHRPYRLPTEAEWEYACRAGTTTPYSSGSNPPAPGVANAWGLIGMESGVPEWVLDWYGRYLPTAQTDPVGPAFGFSKVVRGGGIMAPRAHQHVNTWGPEYRRCAARASVAPSYHGQEPVGFRIAMAAMPDTPPTAAHVPFFRKFVLPTSALPVHAAPDPRKPFFEVHDVLPMPPDDASPLEITAAGLDPELHGHNHSPGLAVMPNGDVMAIFFSSPTSGTEYVDSTTFIGTRLRFGSNQWDTPARFYNFETINDQSALLWNDHGTVRFFGGGIGMAGVPFRLTSSKDNGATWSHNHLPTLVGRIGGFSPQPITSAFRSSDGRTMYVATDAVGGQSLLWASNDGGVTWRDTGGRTFGRHTTFVVLKDGSILGMGGKNTNFEGYMPESISRDGGRTWTERKSPFPPLGSNQRPSIVRLSDGNLFFVSDFQDRKGKKPATEKQSGAFVALSRNEGRTWIVKRIPGARAHEDFYLHNRPQWHVKSFGGFATLGYVVAAQGPNGIIHVLTSMNHPAQEFELNEAWILSKSAGVTALPTGAGRVVSGHLAYPGGKPKAEWRGKIEPDGRFQLDGEQAWFYPDGHKEYQVTYRDGLKQGSETYWAEDGRQIWQWEHHPDGSAQWTQFWPNGQKRQQSEWKGDVCQGPARLWDSTGKLVAQYEFQPDGEIHP